MYPRFSDEETELVPSHMAGKWRSWTRTQAPNPMLFCCAVFNACQERYDVHNQNGGFQESPSTTWFTLSLSNFFVF